MLVSLWKHDYHMILDKIVNMYTTISMLDVNPRLKESLLKDLDRTVKLLKKGKKHDRVSQVIK